VEGEEERNRMVERERKREKLLGLCK